MSLQKWHPDKQKDEDSATSKFQDINEAYQGLSRFLIVPTYLGLSVFACPLCLLLRLDVAFTRLLYFATRGIIKRNICLFVTLIEELCKFC